VPLSAIDLCGIVAMLVMGVVLVLVLTASIKRWRKGRSIERVPLEEQELNRHDR
jgi:hypothetical protein